jgi:hypothetical protein
LPITDKQASILDVKQSTQISPYLEKCCLVISANVSYKNAEKDVKTLTGMYVPAKTQQRLVHRHKFELKNVKLTVKELSVDGGKIRLITPKGEKCIWRDYKGIRLHEQVTQAFFQENQTLIDWTNSQPLDNPITCLGDGHDGIWNVISKISTSTRRREILDWYHLKENIYKIGGSNKRLKKVESLLWKGKVSKTLEFLAGFDKAENFCKYLIKHESRIVNYKDYSERKICSIGSGAVESAVKQIDRRTKISGAQWKTENVPQVLAHRCAYLNDQIV